MKFRHLAASLAILGLLAAGLILPTASSDALQGTIDWHRWNFSDSPYGGPATGSPDPEIVSYHGGIVGLISPDSNYQYALSFPAPVMQLAACENGQDTACEQANLEIPDATGELNPGNEPFFIQAVVRVLDEDTIVGRGINVLQRGAFNGPGGQYKLQLDGDNPGCRWEDKDKNFIKITSDFDITDGEWHDLRCKKTGTGATSKYFLLIDGDVDKRCTSTFCNGGATYTVLGEINPDPGKPVFIAGNKRNNGSGPFVNDQFSGDLALVKIVIGD